MFAKQTPSPRCAVLCQPTVPLVYALAHAKTVGVADRAARGRQKSAGQTQRLSRPDRSRDDVARPRLVLPPGREDPACLPGALSRADTAGDRTDTPAPDGQRLIAAQRAEPIPLSRPG